MNYGPCLVCRRSYQSSAARPFWAFDRFGALIGSVHTACQQNGIFKVDGELSIPAARFQFWLEEVYAVPAPRRLHQAEWHALRMARVAGERVLKQLTSDPTLNVQQEQLLSRVPPSLRLAVEGIYPRLLTGYKEWLSREDAPKGDTIASD
jgi:hypothetical protein